MGMEATYRRPRTSVASPQHRVFPYLLRGLTIERADHVWCTDITYVPVDAGVFLPRGRDGWATRHVLAWRLSNTMDASFCVEALDDALGWRAPEILNTDQGAQFTSEAFADRVLSAGVAFSMNGRGRFLDNILHRAAVAVAEVRGRVSPRTPGRAGRRTHHRFLDRLLLRGASALVPSRADAGRCLSGRHGGGVTTEGFPGAPGHTLRIRRAAGGAPDVRAPCGSQRSPVNPVRQTGDPSAAQGLYWTLPLPFRDRMPGSTLPSDCPTK